MAPAGIQGIAEAEAEVDARSRKTQRACDLCRRRKIKCEGPMNSRSSANCANCQEGGHDCTYVENAKRRGPPKGYIETLEQRCGRLEKMFATLHPLIRLDSWVGPPLDKDNFDLQAYNVMLEANSIPPWPDMKPFALPPTINADTTDSQATPEFKTTSPTRPASASSLAPVSSLPSVAPEISPLDHVLGPTPWSTYLRDPSRPSEDDYEHDAGRINADIADAMSRLKVTEYWRFHGKASGIHLMRHIKDLKYGTGSTQLFDAVAKNKRIRHWKVPEWELAIAQEGVFHIDWSFWPPQGLDRVLIDAYFAHVNIHLPLLNKIIFDRQYNSGLYRSHLEFAKICWMVFANGSRFVDDDRVLWSHDQASTHQEEERLKTDVDGIRRFSAGWKYMRALLRMGKSIIATPHLYDIECQVLLCVFLSGSAAPHMTWIVSGYGLRSAQELGIHIRSRLLRCDAVERALLSRAFWCLYHIDRTNCAAIGRSVALQDTDFDADYPAAVDDEFWETGNPDTDFVQPPASGLPKISAFTHMLKLDHVIGAALSTIYAVNKPPEYRAESQRATVVDLDSALNEWADGVPDGLRWDPTRDDQLLFQQSAVLYIQYYFVRILVHRPFIPTIRSPNTVGSPSLAICANAARSISHILDASLRRGYRYGLLPGRILDGSSVLPAWLSATILLISVYSGKQQPAERATILSDVRKCLAALKDMELTWRQAGKFTDMLVELLRENEPVSNVQLHQGQKRPLPTYSNDGATFIGGLNSKVNANSSLGPVSSSTSARSPNIWSNLRADFKKASSSTSSNHIPSTPPTMWQWSNIDPQYPPLSDEGCNLDVHGSATANDTGDVFGLEPHDLPNFVTNLSHHSPEPNVNAQPNMQINSGPFENPNHIASTNRSTNNNGVFDIESFSDDAIYGGSAHTMGDGMGMEIGNEDDIWAQLFGDFPLA